MATFNFRVTLDFKGVEADDYQKAVELIDSAMGGVIFQHPTTKEEIVADYDGDEVEDE